MYQPNVDAAQHLANAAHNLPDYQIHLIGASSALVETSAPNVTRHGHVDDKTLDALLRDAHMLVNLVTDGSGTHLKISKSLAYGVPVVTTKIGSRGYTDTHITEIANAPATIRAITADWDTHHTTALEAAKQYDWQPIRQQFAGVINALQ
jgi:glycosyltransferase involved in cell wall biosynthesis